MRKREAIPSYDIAPILEYLGAELPLHQSTGGWTKMRCPFHPDNRPSATVNFQANKFHCFSCGVHQDGIGLLQHAEGTDFKTAHGQAAELSGEGYEGVRRGGGRRRTLFGE